MSTYPKSIRIPRFRLSLVREAETNYERDLLDRPATVAEWLWRELYHDAAQETVSALFTDVRHRLIGFQVAYVGTLWRSAVEPRAILTAGLLCNASGCIVAHNHPSSDPWPSQDDLKFTRRMEDAGEVVGVRLLDHLVLGGSPQCFVSLRRWQN